MSQFSSPGGATLGEQTTATVTIVKSDYPNGEFGFLGQTELSMENPEELKSVSVTIARTGGLLGKQVVSFSLKSGVCLNSI